MFKQLCFRLLLLASAIATSLSAAAYSFESAGIYYNITGDNTVEVTYSDRNNNTYSGSVSIPETVTSNGTEYSVTTIGESAFKGSAVTSVSMPEGITSIDYNAFSGCQNLETVALPESLTIFGFRAFESCKLLKTIKIPSGVTAIPGSCFYCCSSLESVTIPEGVTTIGDGAFFGCNLKELTLPSTVTMVGSDAFIRKNRFQSITCNATTPPNLGENVFGYNASTAVKVPLQSIAAYRQANGWKNFSNYCSGEVVNNGITYRIEENGAMVAVAEATLTEANILSAVEFEGNQYPVIKINDNVFADNTNLTAVTLPKGLVEIGASAFLGCKNLESVVLPESLTTLGSRSFEYCQSLKTIKIPSGVTAIPDYCFNHCLSLESVTIPVGVMTIGQYAFLGCNLKELTLPSTVTMIGSRAFVSNNRFQSITCNATTPPSLGENAFNYNISTTVKVPLSSIAAYRQANGWKNFSNYCSGEVVNNGITYRIEENGAMVAVAEATLTEANILSAVEFEGNQYPVIKINDNVFADNTNLTAVTLPKGLVEIGASAFLGCKNLESVVLPESLTTLGSRSFEYCQSLKTIKIPSGVTAIPDYCFNHCLSLESVTIPEGVTTIGDGAFFGCNLKELTLPSTVTMVGSDAFIRKNRFQSITCNATTPPNLGENVFGYNASTAVKVPLQSIAAYRQAEGWKGFANYYYGGEMIADGITYRIDDNGAMVAVAEATLAEANIPSAVEFEGNQYPVIKVNDSVFYGCSQLKALTLPESLIEIGHKAFYGCGLTELVIPEGVQTIGNRAFGSNSLQNLTLPSTITSIGNYAFGNNNNLKSIICNAVTPPTLGENAIGSSVKEIKVPISSIAAYKQANGWKNFTNYYGGDVVNNGITYRIDENGATITAAEATLAEANIPSAVEFEGNQYLVIKINDKVFADNTNLTVVTLSEGLVEIGAYAFYGCQNLESVAFPESLTTLGDDAFISCKLLKTIKIPFGVTTIPYRCFFGCSSLESVTIPEGVTAIGDNAFGSCNLNALTLPESLEKIGSHAFSYNRVLKSVNIPAKVKTIGAHAFYNCGLTELLIPEGVQTIDNYAFEYNSLQNLTLPSTITSIGDEAFRYNSDFQSIICNAATPPTLGDNAFRSNISIKVPMASIVAYRQAEGWKNFTNYYGGEVVADGITYRIDENGATIIAAEATLTEANIPSSVEFEGNQYAVTKINDKAFSDNTNLASVTLPESLTTLGDRAFYTCKSLKTIKIPSGVTAIPGYCFDGCSSLESVTIPEGVMTIGDGAFYACSINALTLPESLEKIGIGAFSYNRVLKSVNIPAKVKTIEERTFIYCGLTDLVIPEGVQTIDNYAFEYNSLQNLTLPSTITSIGKSVFYDNFDLESIICNAATPPTLGDNAFSSGIMSDVKVPLASIAAYRKAYGWKDFSNYYGGEEIIDGVAYRIDDKGAYVQAAIMTESEICLAENVAFEGAQYPLYKIADNAFAGNGSITLVTVPATVETIGSNAFDGVTYPIIKIKATTPPVLASKLPMLSAIVPPASVKAYKAANYWKDMTIIGEGKNDIEVTTSATVDLTEAIMTQAKITPASVTSIKVHGPLTNDDIINALNTNMRSCYAIDLSDAEIEALPDEAFNGKIGLLEITLPAGLKAIGNNAFRGCFALRNEVTIPAGVETIGNYAFLGCRNAKFNPALPETLTAIGDYAFQNCANLYAVTLPAGLQTIGDHAFEASNVQEAVLPAGLKTIGAYAFRKCSNITRVTLPDGLTTLGEGAFQQCEALVTADLMNPMEITSIPRYAFDGCSGLRNVYLPFFIEAIGDYAFRGCASLRQIQFVAPTKTIGAYAFSGCRSLKSLDLFKSENFTTIGEYAFSGCTSLKSLNLPKSLETIGEYAFSGCQAISVISSPSLVPPTIASESALNGIDKDVCVLTMPKSVYLDYFRAPYWGQFVEYTASVLVGVDGQGSVMYSNNYGTAPTPVKVAAFYATAGEGEGVEEDEGDGITAEAYDSANICAKDNSTLTFRIVPDEGNEIKSVTYAGEDVTAQVVDGLFTTPVINGDTNLDVSFVASTDYIAIPVSAVSKGAEVVMPVELVNTTEVMGIECKVQIPEGFSVAKKADGSLKVEQTERKADQTLTAAVDGSVLTVKTSGTQAYTGNTGAVFTIAIAPDEATAPADYVLKVTDVKFVNATGVASRPDAKTTLTLRDYVLGDVDSDQLVAINDAVIVMNHIVGADTPAFNAKAADMDGNGSVEINDAVLIMNTVVGTESTKSIKKTSATEPNADELTAADIEICQGGTAMLSLDLANLDALTAAQFEITLPEGITAGKAEAGERASRHMVKTNMVGNVLKVAMLSAESADFEGSEGAILVLPLSADKTMPSGSYGISLHNVKMSDARGNLFILPDADSSVVVKDWSGVDSVAFDRLRVYGGNGEICIESPADTMIQIVAVDGRAFAVEASAGKTAVAVSAGVYVVNGQKVIVK